MNNKLEDRLRAYGTVLDAATTADVAERISQPSGGEKRSASALRRTVAAVVVLIVIGVAALAVATAGGHPRTNGNVHGAPTTTATLAFREVLASFPYANSDASSAPVGSVPSGSAGPSSCDGGRLVTPPEKQTADGSVVLADSKQTVCYQLGPTLLTGRNVTAAAALFDKTTSSWVVNIHFGTDDFLQKVASAEVNKQIAIIVDGVVESAPEVNPGITSRDVQIGGAFDKDTARRIAAALVPSSGSRTPTP